MTGPVESNSNSTTRLVDSAGAASPRGSITKPPKRRTGCSAIRKGITRLFGAALIVGASAAVGAGIGAGAGFAMAGVGAAAGAVLGAIAGAIIGVTIVAGILLGAACIAIAMGIKRMLQGKETAEVTHQNNAPAPAAVPELDKESQVESPVQAEAEEDGVPPMKEVGLYWEAERIDRVSLLDDSNQVEVPHDIFGRANPVWNQMWIKVGDHFVKYYELRPMASPTDAQKLVGQLLFSSGNNGGLLSNVDPDKRSQAFAYLLSLWAALHAPADPITTAGMDLLDMGDEDPIIKRVAVGTPLGMALEERGDQLRVMAKLVIGEYNGRTYTNRQTSIAYVDVSLEQLLAGHRFETAQVYTTSEITRPSPPPLTAKSAAG